MPRSMVCAGRTRFLQERPAWPPAVARAAAATSASSPTGMAAATLPMRLCWQGGCAEKGKAVNMAVLCFTAARCAAAPGRWRWAQRPAPRPPPTAARRCRWRCTAPPCPRHGRRCGAVPQHLPLARAPSEVRSSRYTVPSARACTADTASTAHRPPTARPAMPARRRLPWSRPRLLHHRRHRQQRQRGRCFALRMGRQGCRHRGRAAASTVARPRCRRTARRARCSTVKQEERRSGRRRAVRGGSSGALWGCRNNACMVRAEPRPEGNGLRQWRAKALGYRLPVLFWCKRFGMQKERKEKKASGR